MNGGSRQIRQMNGEGVPEKNVRINLNRQFNKSELSDGTQHKGNEGCSPIQGASPELPNRHMSSSHSPKSPKQLGPKNKHAVESMLPLLAPRTGQNPPKTATYVRDTFKKYFFNEGQVEWQYEIVSNNAYQKADKCIANAIL